MSDGIHFSVVTPSFNQGRYIRKNIESVLEQDVRDVEHIVIDGGSRDETVDILKEYSCLKWISEPDRGQSDALNKGIAMARGNWIVWINSDDYLLPGALKKTNCFLEQHPDAQFVYSNSIVVDSDGRQIRSVKAEFVPSRFYHWWRRGVGLPQPGTFFKKSLWDIYGPYRIDLHYTMDYEFWLRIKDDIPFLYLDEYTAAFRLHGQSKSGKGNFPFSMEKIEVTRRYWDGKGGFEKWKMRLLLALLHGRKLMLEGIRQWDAGEKERARLLWLEGYLRNPFCIFSYPHLCFRLKQILGEQRYEILRDKYRFWLKAGG